MPVCNIVAYVTSLLPFVLNCSVCLSFGWPLQLGPYSQLVGLPHSRTSILIDENKGAHRKNWCRFQPPSENMQLHGNKAK